MLNFVADLSLAECQERLASQDVKSPRFAILWKKSIAVKIETIDANTCQFHLKHREDPSLINWGSMGELRGAMQVVNGHSTQITGQVKINWLYIIVSQILFALLSMVMIFSWLSDGTFSAKSQPFLILGAVIINALGFAFLWFYTNAQAQELENIVKRMLT